MATAGSNYGTAPPVHISGGGGHGATATATITNRAISAITVTSAGSGYTSSPTIVVGGINAVVERMLPEMIAEGKGKVPMMRVHLRKDTAANGGIASLDTGGDRIAVAYRKGWTAENFMVHPPENQDGSIWTIPLK